MPTKSANLANNGGRIQAHLTVYAVTYSTRDELYCQLSRPPINSLSALFRQLREDGVSSAGIEGFPRLGTPSGTTVRGDWSSPTHRYARALRSRAEPSKHSKNSRVELVELEDTSRATSLMNLEDHPKFAPLLCPPPHMPADMGNDILNEIRDAAGFQRSMNIFASALMMGLENVIVTMQRGADLDLSRNVNLVIIRSEVVAPGRANEATLKRGFQIEQVTMLQNVARGAKVRQENYKRHMDLLRHFAVE